MPYASSANVAALPIWSRYVVWRSVVPVLQLMATIMLSQPRFRISRASRRLLTILISGFILLDSLLIVSHSPLPARVSPGSDTHTQKIFIASIHRNNEFILRTHWSEAILNLTRHYGPANVYFSTYESGSLEGTKEALSDLDEELGALGVRRSVVLDYANQINEVSREPTEDEEGWIMTSTGRRMLRRIPYLANLRNEVMQKLLDEAEEGRTYDLVLWLNDVVFNTEDIVTLISTRNGKYDAVCAMDYSKASFYYDTFALRDSLGHKAVPPSWPYFQSSSSRHALINNEPVPVESCWNGVVVFKARPFYKPLDPLRFRGVPDSLAAFHLEGSECCLIHVDNQAAGDGQGVWLNPNVRVAYNVEAYKGVNPTNGHWPGWWWKIKGMWLNRMGRVVYRIQRVLEDGEIKARVHSWAQQVRGTKEDHDPGLFCLINEQQVLYGAGWKHV